ALPISRSSLRLLRVRLAFATSPPLSPRFPPRGGWNDDRLRADRNRATICRLDGLSSRWGAEAAPLYLPVGTRSSGDDREPRRRRGWGSCRLSHAFRRCRRSRVMG